MSERSFCVFAQAKHEFKAGIIQVAEEAIKQGVKGVRLLKDQDLSKITGFSKSGYEQWDLEAMQKALRGVAVDVFYYGFDVDAELRSLATRKGSRREVWNELDKQWKSVVVQKKAAEATTLLLKLA